MKHAAQAALLLEKGVDYIVETTRVEQKDEAGVTKVGEYIIEKGKQFFRKRFKKVQKVVIIDPNTGYKKPGNRWENYLHEMVEIKENVEVKPPSISYCSIPQCMFFNLYESICGVTGTIGDNKDKSILVNQYKVKLFKVPRNIPPKKVIFERERSNDPIEMKRLLVEEIQKERNRGRPVLVILDSVKRVDEIIYLFPDAGIIKGISPEQEREVIKNAGKPRTLTIATLAAGRGMDIKLDQQSKDAGGLHVIIPYLMPNVRCLEQAIGRSGRQGQPGTATVYIDPIDKFEDTMEFHPTHSHLMELQSVFAEFIRENYLWIYEYPLIHTITEQYPFGINVEELLDYLKMTVMNREMSMDDQQKYVNYIREMIMISWGVFYTNIASNLDDYKDKDKCLKEYNDYITLLQDKIPIEYESFTKSLKGMVKGITKNMDWETIFNVLGVKVLGSVVTSVFGPTVGAIVTTISGMVISGGFEIINQLRNGGKINWWKVLVTASKGAFSNILEIFDVSGQLGSFTNDIFDQVTECLIQSVDEISETTEIIFDETTNYLCNDGAGKVTDFVSEKMFEGLGNIGKTKEEMNLMQLIETDLNKKVMTNNEYRKLLFKNETNYSKYQDENKILLLHKDVLNMFN